MGLCLCLPYILASWLIEKFYLFQIPVLERRADIWLKKSIFLFRCCLVFVVEQFASHSKVCSGHLTHFSRLWSSKDILYCKDAELSETNFKHHCFYKINLRDATNLIWSRIGTKNPTLKKKQPKKPTWNPP